ncbi:IS30 family transposase [Amycolatopsis sp. DSM 110486]|uniref:IS30 family transposase n=1 Tax=Amycolatopsis sp. DSM 110486 TaxID=2865832 RepID=UPI001C698C3A|nr:IS30 family transposase [Amycolatopsis sp. DSM 110486]QYN18939.1 IS30 family transposase [Amycolatopsis sp. DSM 110486]
MARLGRPGMSDPMKEELWGRWRAGESISVIGRALDKPPGSVFTVLKHHGGIAPKRPVSRADHLSVDEREVISRGISAQLSFRAIAASLGRSASTVSREVRRNGGRDVYRAVAAQERADDQRKRPKQSLLARNPILRNRVVDWLEQEWSPQQIARRLRLEHEGDPDMMVSHETIYRSVYTSRWKLIPKAMSKKLRTGRPIRKNKRHSVKGQWRSQIIDARPITDRPAEAEDRSVIGHLEGDLIVGGTSSQVATLVDRKTRYLTVVQLADRRTETVVAGLIERYATMPETLHRSLTWDRGMELADHRVFTTATGVDVFFAAPRSPWQRGTNENTNKLLRQYLPKGTNLAAYSQTELDAIADRLNNRPRKCLGYGSIP